MTDTRDQRGIVFVDHRGNPMLSESEKQLPPSRARIIQLVLESTVTGAIGTAILYYIGYVYYRSYFGSFGPTLTFPPMGTTEYLTRAFDLVSSPFIILLGIVWIVTFVTILEQNELISTMQQRNREVAIQRRLIGELEWQLRKRNKVFEKNLDRLKKSRPDAYEQYLKECPRAREKRRTNWRRVAYVAFPYQLRPMTLLTGVSLNLYVFLTVALIVVTAISLDATNAFLWSYAVAFTILGIVASITRKSLFHIVRRNMSESLFNRVYYQFGLLVLLLVTARYLTGSVGHYDARQFMSGDGDGNNITIVDTRSNRPDLEGRTFRLLLVREGDLYLVPGNQSEIEAATLVVIPQTEIISQTIEQIED